MNIRSFPMYAYTSAFSCKLVLRGKVARVQWNYCTPLQELSLKLLTQQLPVPVKC